MGTSIMKFRTWIIVFAAVLSMMQAGCLDESTDDTVNRCLEETDSADDITSPYRFANDCCSLGFENRGVYVAMTGKKYTAGGIAESFYMKPSALAEYILYGTDGMYLAVRAEGGTVSVVRTGVLDDNVRWRLAFNEDLGGFTLQSYTTSGYLSIGADNGLVLAGEADSESVLLIETAARCRSFPEAELNVEFNVDPATAMARPNPGSAGKNYSDRENVVGFMDDHTHLNHFLGSGETTFVGETYNPLGISMALRDCSLLHGTMGVNDIFGMAMDGAVTHKTSGFPEFAFWPTSYSSTHQQAYYRWLERSWLAGQRMLVQHMVNNETLCKLKRSLPGGKKDVSCDDMEIARIQTANMYAMQDYIDAQCGGPGRGWFRIVKSSREAREVIGRGKMAVILALEFDTIFGAEEDYFTLYDKGEISKAELDDRLRDIEEQLDDYYKMGIRSIFPVHAFNNGFGGAQLYKTPVFNLVNKIERGTFYQVEISDNPRVQYQELGIPVEDLDLLELLYPMTVYLPLVPEAGDGQGHCNAIGLSRLGAWFVERLMERGIIIEIDHMSGYMLEEVMAMLWEAKYPGIIASHTRVLDLQEGQDAWEKMDIPVMLKILQLGGIVAPMIKDTLTGHQQCVADYLALMIEGGGRLDNETYEKYGEYEVPPSWYNINDDPNDDLLAGVPYATDVNGACPLPNFDDLPEFRGEIAYPFGGLYEGVYSPGTEVRFYRQITGNRVFDINGGRGMAHLGMMPDLVRKMQLRQDIISMDAFFSGAEAYLRMLERVERYSDTYPSRHDEDWQ